MPSEFDVSSVELWAAAKIVARECATVSKNFIMCKASNGESPADCLNEGAIVTSCTNNVVRTLQTKFPVELENFRSCLDKNDYRYPDCRSQEKALLDCWNNAMVIPASTKKGQN